MKTLHHKDESKAVKPIINDNLDFIAKNITYPEPHSPGQKEDVSLNKMMTHLGGTRGEMPASPTYGRRKLRKCRKNKRTSRR